MGVAQSRQTWAAGASRAGGVLSGSTLRRRSEAGGEPVSGILVGVFGVSVGVARDLGVGAGNGGMIGGMVLALMAAKALCIYVVARGMGSDHAQAMDRGVLMVQGGEFAFVLFSAAASAGVINMDINANFTAVVVLSMALTPLVVLVYKRVAPKPEVSLEGVDTADGLSGSVLMIGFGRFGQVASQSLLARDVDVTIIDNDVEMIHNAERFGFKIYYGDGTRLDVLRASGAGTARAIAVCVNNAEDAARIVELAAHEFPHAKLPVRSFDPEHPLRLIHAGVDFQIRETFESALMFGQAALMELGADEDDAQEIAEQIRERDAERFELEMAGGSLRAGAHMVFGSALPGVPTPTPVTAPKRKARTLNADQVPEEEED